MAKGIYVQRGETIDYVNGGAAAIAAGDIVTLSTRIGIAADPIAVGAIGAVHVTGVFDLPKKASEALATVGAAVYYSADGITATSTNNTPAGWVVKAAAAGDALVRVKIG